MSPADRQAVLDAIENAVSSEPLRRHMLATECIMRALAVRLSEPADEWALAGLLHDLDSESTADDSDRHGLASAEELERLGVSALARQAVAAHNPATGVDADFPMAIGLQAADQLSGLITAATYVRPDRSLPGVKLKSLRKRFRETAFARAVDRASIARAEELGLSLDEFLELGLIAMQSQAEEIGLGGTEPD